MTWDTSNEQGGKKKKIQTVSVKWSIPGSAARLGVLSNTAFQVNRVTGSERRGGGDILAEPPDGK